jgi:hypothetical protein
VRVESGSHGCQLSEISARGELITRKTTLTQALYDASAASCGASLWIPTLLVPSSEGPFPFKHIFEVIHHDAREIKLQGPDEVIVCELNDQGLIKSLRDDFCPDLSKAQVLLSKHYSVILNTKLFSNTWWCELQIKALELLF